MRWPLQPLQPLQQTQLQPPFGQSVGSLCHPWFTTTNVSYRFPILKLPPPPCAVLLVYHICIIYILHYIILYYITSYYITLYYIILQYIIMNHIHVILYYVWILKTWLLRAKLPQSYQDEFHLVRLWLCSMATCPTLKQLADLWMTAAGVSGG